jgi:CHAT domain-containing protein
MSVIVEDVKSRSLAELAGLRRGDRLMTYAGLALTSPAMLLSVEENTFGVERVIMYGERDGRPQEWTLPPGLSGCQVRPELPDSLLDEYEGGRAAFQAKEHLKAALIWGGLAPRMPDASTRAWLSWKAGQAAEEGYDWRRARSFYAAACEALECVSDSAAQSATWTATGLCCERLSESAEAKRWFVRSRQTNEAADRRIWFGRDRVNIGRIGPDQQDALWHYTEALDLFERLTPDSLDVAVVLNNLGQITDDLDLGKAYQTRALALWERLDPDSLLVAHGLNIMAGWAVSEGDISGARAYYHQSYELRLRLAPESLVVAESLNNLAFLAHTCGDMTAAQDYCARASVLWERLIPDSLLAATSLDNLGVLAQTREDLEAAQGYHERALEIRERLTPPFSPECAPSILYMDIASSLINLGDVVYRREKNGGPTGAKALYLRAFEICEHVRPDSKQTASVLANLGICAEENGDLTEAQHRFTRAVGVCERVLPGTLELAGALENLGRVRLAQDDPEEAKAHFQRSVELVEQQRTQIVTPEARALLLSQHLTKYAGLLQAYLALGDTANAFHTLERARARSLVELLTDRALDLTADAPPDLLAEQEALSGQRTVLYEQLAGFAGESQDAETVTTLHQTLRELERRQQALTAQIRDASPRYASVQYPQPLTLEASQALLGPGTLLLSYLVTDDQTFLFAMTEASAEVHVLPVGREALKTRVRDFRLSLDRNGRAYAATQEAELARALYADLVHPARAAVRRAQRLLLCLDGPLHTLPFAALVSNTGLRPRYLGAEKPLGHILSMTTHAQAVAAHPPTATTHGPGLSPKPPRLLAFGDPLYGPPSRTGDSPAGVDELSLLQTRGLSIAPLPHSRIEVEGLARLFGAAATVRLGAEATKTAVLQEGGSAELLHLACHGWFDPELPLSSGLVLSRPEALTPGEAPADNGLLQAWEIFQHLRLSADLVVLSACQSGLGQEVRGEGLVGLTRAFQYAGARSLVVTLWEVNDASTSVFMQAFYACLKSGMSKDEALRRGILALRSDHRWDAPCFWGAFVLIGDRN